MPLNDKPACWSATVALGMLWDAAFVKAPNAETFSANFQKLSAPEAPITANVCSEKRKESIRQLSGSGFRRRRMGTDNAASKSLKTRR